MSILQSLSSKFVGVGVASVFAQSRWDDGSWGWGPGMMGWGMMGWIGGIMMLVFWVVIIAAVVIFHPVADFRGTFTAPASGW